MEIISEDKINLMAHGFFWGLFLALQTLLAVGWCDEKGVPAANAAGQAKRFWVMAYNVENLMDVDRVAPYDDYAEIPEDPNSYNPTKLLRKLQTICRVLKSTPGGIGPDVVILNELEVDQTPESSVADLKDFLAKHEATTYEKMLTTELTDELRGLPVEAWLLKAL